MLIRNFTFILTLAALIYAGRSDLASDNVYNWNFYSGPCPVQQPLPPVVQICNEIAKEPEIYWKAYYGPPLPTEALKAGVSFKNGKAVSVYVGQVLVMFQNAGIQTVGIYDDSPNVTNTYHQTTKIDKNIKVLCTNLPQDDLDQFLAWIPSEEAYKLNPEKDLVETGYENSYPLYAGRYRTGREMYVAKAIRAAKNFRFYYTKADKEVRLETGFDVLVYTKAFLELRK